MPAKKPPSLPPQLSIGQLATRGGIAASAVRFYEIQGLLHSTRAANNQRRYQRDCLRRIAFIRAAQDVGLSLEEIKIALDHLPKHATAKSSDWKALARSWQQLLDERTVQIERLRAGSAACIGCGCMSLESCKRDNPSDVAYGLGHGPQYWKGGTPAQAAAAVDKPRKRNPLQRR